MSAISAREQIEGLPLQPCRRCGCDRWNVYTWLIGGYVTAFASCEECDALYFTSGEDGNRNSALSALLRIINGGSPPSVL